MELGCPYTAQDVPIHRMKNPVRMPCCGAVLCRTCAAKGIMRARKSCWLRCGRTDISLDELRPCEMTKRRLREREEEVTRVVRERGETVVQGADWERSRSRIRERSRSKDRKRSRSRDRERSRSRDTGRSDIVEVASSERSKALGQGADRARSRSRYRERSRSRDRERSDIVEVASRERSKAVVQGADRDSSDIVELASRERSKPVVQGAGTKAVVQVAHRERSDVVEVASRARSNVVEVVTRKWSGSERERRIVYDVPDSPDREQADMREVSYKYWKRTRQYESSKPLKKLIKGEQIGKERSCIKEEKPSSKLMGKVQSKSIPDLAKCQKTENSLSDISETSIEWEEKRAIGNDEYMEEEDDDQRPKREVSPDYRPQEEHTDTEEDLAITEVVREPSPEVLLVPQCPSCSCDQFKYLAPSSSWLLDQVLCPSQHRTHQTKVVGLVSTSPKNQIFLAELGDDDGELAQPETAVQYFPIPPPNSLPGTFIQLRKVFQQKFILLTVAASLEQCRKSFLGPGAVVGLSQKWLGRKEEDLRPHQDISLTCENVTVEDNADLTLLCSTELKLGRPLPFMVTEHSSHLELRPREKLCVASKNGMVNIVCRSSKEKTGFLPEEGDVVGTIKSDIDEEVMGNVIKLVQARKESPKKVNIPSKLAQKRTIVTKTVNIPVVKTANVPVSKFKFGVKKAFKAKPATQANVFGDEDSDSNGENEETSKEETTKQIIPESWRLEALIEEKYGRQVLGSEAAAQGDSPQSDSTVMDQSRMSVSQDKDTGTHPGISVVQNKDTYRYPGMSGVHQSSGKMPCKWHQSGNCKFGVNCLYSHESSTISPHQSAENSRYTANLAYVSNTANPSYSHNIANPSYSHNTANPSYSPNTANPSYSHNTANPSYYPYTANAAFPAPSLMHDFSRPPPGFGPCTIPATGDSVYRPPSSQTSPSVHRPSALHSLPPPIPALQGTQRPLVPRPQPP